MKASTLSLAAILAFLPVAAQAQVHVGIQLGLPALPNLVVVAPGIQVVEGFQDEVFLQGGWYWCRRPDGWYRSRSPRANFGWVDARRVPGGLSRMPAGRYQNWHHEGGGHDNGRHEGDRHEGNRGNGHGGHEGGHERGHEEGGHHER